MQWIDHLTQKLKEVDKKVAHDKKITKMQYSAQKLQFRTILIFVYWEENTACKQIEIPCLVTVLLSIPFNKLPLTTPSLWRPSVTMVQECMGAIPCSTIAVFQMPNASLTPQTEVSYWTLGRRPKSLKAKKLPPGEVFFTNFHLFFNQSESFVQKVRVEIVKILYLIHPKDFSTGLVEKSLIHPVFWCGMGNWLNVLFPYQISSHNQNSLFRINLLPFTFALTFNL